MVDPVTKDPGEAEVLNASFASVLNSKICPHKHYIGSVNHPRLLKLMHLRKKKITRILLKGLFRCSRIK